MPRQICSNFLIPKQPCFQLQPSPSRKFNENDRMQLIGNRVTVFDRIYLYPLNMERKRP